LATRCTRCLSRSRSGPGYRRASLDLSRSGEKASRQLVADLIASAPAALAGMADWSEQHEKQMRVGIVHAVGNVVALGLYGASLAPRDPRLSRALRFTGLAAVSVGGLLGGHISFRLAGWLAEPTMRRRSRTWSSPAGSTSCPWSTCRRANRCARCSARSRSWPSRPTARSTCWPTVHPWAGRQPVV
jgi:hypothetical protein